MIRALDIMMMMMFTWIVCGNKVVPPAILQSEKRNSHVMEPASTTQGKTRLLTTAAL